MFGISQEFSSSLQVHNFEIVVAVPGRIPHTEIQWRPMLLEGLL